MNKDTEILLATELEKFRHELNALENIVGELVADVDTIKNELKGGQNE